MRRWSAATVHSRETGKADTLVHAWQAGHVAATGLLRCGDRTRLTLQVDRQAVTVRPTETGDPVVAVVASLHRIDTNPGGTLVGSDEDAATAPSARSANPATAAPLAAPAQSPWGD